MNEVPQPFSDATSDVERSPQAGQMAVLLAGLLIGVLLMGLQLWLLTLALDLYLSGRNEQTWQLVVISGLIFLGGLLILRLSVPRRHGKRRRTT